MALPPAPNGSARISLLHVSNGKQWGTHFWVKQASAAAPSAAECSTLAAAIGAEWSDQFVPAFSASTTFEECLVTWHDGSGGEVIGSDATPVAGEDTNDVLPLSICMVISWRIAAGYRGGKPRMYLSGMTQHLLGSGPGFWGVSITTAFSAGAAHMLGVVNALELASETVTMGELSYFEDAAERGGTPPPVQRTVPLFRAFTGGVAKPPVGHQRRRDLS